MGPESNNRNFSRGVLHRHRIQALGVRQSLLAIVRFHLIPCELNLPKDIRMLTAVTNRQQFSYWTTDVIRGTPVWKISHSLQALMFCMQDHVICLLQ